MSNSKKKNTTGNVLKTKVEPLKTVNLTKSQGKLFVAMRKAHREGMKVIIDEYSKLSEELLTDAIGGFGEELKINAVDDNWQFDQNKLQFTRVIEKPVKKGLPVRAESEEV